MLASSTYQAACRIDPAAPIDQRVEQVLSDPDLQAEVMARAMAQIDALAAKGRITVEALRYRDRLLATLCASARADDPAYANAREALALQEARQAALAKSAAPSAGQSSRLDWGKAAELLALGLKPTDVAATLGTSPERIWRNLERSARFRRRIERQRQRHLQAAGFRLNGATEQVANGLISSIDRKNPRVMLWMAERMKIGPGAMETNGGPNSAPVMFSAPELPREIPEMDAESNR
jgi:hypothetical protein